MKMLDFVEEHPVLVAVLAIFLTGIICNTIIAIVEIVHGVCK